MGRGQHRSWQLGNPKASVPFQLVGQCWSMIPKEVQGILFLGSGRGDVLLGGSHSVGLGERRPNSQQRYHSLSGLEGPSSGLQRS